MTFLVRLSIVVILSMLAPIATWTLCGSVYVRWGNDSCPQDAELVYSGMVGGSYFNHAGAAANYLCLPRDPDLFEYRPVFRSAFLFGGEYDSDNTPEFQMNAVCAVCRIQRSTSLMIPAKLTCKSGWTKEYSGYLMAGGWNLAAASEYICVDSSLGFVQGTQANDNGVLLFHTYTRCGSLHCPSYAENKGVYCVVCSK